MAYIEKVAAGGIVVRQREGVREIVIVQHKENGKWGFPKGHVDPGETPDQTAIREVEEETGALGEIVFELSPTHYFFTDKRKGLIRKTVHWYLMRYAGEGKQTHAYEIGDMRWVTIDEAPGLLGFENDRRLLDDAQEHLHLAE